MSTCFDNKILLIKTRNRCAHCGKELNSHTATIEHIFPKSKGGRDDEYNLTVLCKQYNLLKANYVYDLNFYKYIDKKYSEDYKTYHMKVLNEKRGQEILAHDPLRICIVPEFARHLLSKKNGKKPKRIPSSSAYLAWTETSRAYPGDAEEISSLIRMCLGNKGFIATQSYYENDMKVLRDIKEGRVFAVRAKNRIVGAILMRKYEDMDLGYPQITNMAENNNLTPAYVITGIFSERPYATAVSEVLAYIEARMVSIGMCPIYLYGTDGKEPKDTLVFPYKMEDFNGKICVPTSKDIRKILMAEMVRTVFAKNNVPIPDLEIFAEIWLKRGEKLLDYEKEIIEKYPKMKDLLQKETRDLRDGHDMCKVIF